MVVPEVVVDRVSCLGREAAEGVYSGHRTVPFTVPMLIGVPHNVWLSSLLQNKRALAFGSANPPAESSMDSLLGMGMRGRCLSF